MSTTDKNNIVRDKDSKYQNFNTNESGQINDHFNTIENEKESDNDSREIAERGYAIRNGHNPNKPNPDEDINAYDDDLDDLSDDFHNDRDLEDADDDYYEVVLEEGEEFDDEFDDEDEYIEEDLDDEVEEDEFDNPADTFENDFSETEAVLEDIDDDYDYKNHTYVEDDVQRKQRKTKYTKEDQRRFY